ncbi:MAG TPA: hypothetical protein VGR26_07320 [Acidimicrobiales bacterium]|nr:hypothetical protein [Acidimicrobiales bacterium]
MLDAYLVTRRARFPRHDLDHPPPLPSSSTSVAEGWPSTRSST